MAAYVIDKDPPPPELVRAFDYKTWGVNVHEMPPGEVRAVTTAWNAYQHLNGYYSAPPGRAVEWTKRNPQGWEFVSGIIAERKRRKNG